MSAAQSRAAEFHQRGQHFLQIEGRAADDLEHVGGRRLLGQQLTQLAEQPGILDGDDRLGGEILDQIDLALGERLHPLARKPKCANCLAPPEQRYSQDRPYEAFTCGLLADMFIVSANVGYLNRAAFRQRSADGRPAAGCI